MDSLFGDSFHKKQIPTDADVVGHTDSDVTWCPQLLCHTHDPARVAQGPA